MVDRWSGWEPGMTRNEQLYVCTEALQQLEKKANDTLRDLCSALLFLLS